MKTLDEITKLDDMINQVICGDSLEVLKKIPDNSVDLVLTDPPYGIGMDKLFAEREDFKKEKGFKSRKKYEMGDEWDNKIPSKEYFDEIFRVSKNQIIWGGNYFVENLTNSSCWLVWYKKGNDKSNFADCELAWTSFKTAVKFFEYPWIGVDYINQKKYDEKSHPTQKPRALMRWCLEKYSQPNDLVLDCFLGSGTTARACKDLGRRFIGVEISEKYCEIAEERLKQEVLF